MVQDRSSRCKFNRAGCINHPVSHSLAMQAGIRNAETKLGWYIDTLIDKFMMHADPRKMRGCELAAGAIKATLQAIFQTASAFVAKATPKSAFPVQLPIDIVGNFLQMVSQRLQHDRADE